ncbi:hypothetical protein OG301_39100 (plasmid) [Streptomyces platensis]|uniref:hypothetical protein n=1 Tax=Streptomyces platensis TaxID=58346 RepID=UPI002ED52E3F|nr:hypothetical protein OG301_39100 [Streptomyces platensis]
MAGTTTPAPRPRALAQTLRHWQGRALLWTAKTLQNTIVGRHRRKALTAHRNRAMRAAYARGVPATVIAKAVALAPSTVTGICGRSTGARDESVTDD